MLGTLFNKCPICSQKSVRKELLLARKNPKLKLKSIKEHVSRKIGDYFKSDTTIGEIFRGAMGEPAKVASGEADDIEFR